MIGCLRERTLFRLAEGEGTARQRRHLASCPRCQTRAEALVHARDLAATVLSAVSHEGVLSNMLRVTVAERRAGTRASAPVPGEADRATSGSRDARRVFSGPRRPRRASSRPRRAGRWIVPLGAAAALVASVVLAWRPWITLRNDGSAGGASAPTLVISLEDVSQSVFASSDEAEAWLASDGDTWRWEAALRGERPCESQEGALDPWCD